MKVHTLKEYCRLIGSRANPKKLEDIAEYLNENDLWDYPLEELRYCIDENKNVVVVQVAENEYRLCEV